MTLQLENVNVHRQGNHVLHNLSLLFGRSFGNAQELNRYRKELLRGAEQTSAA